METVYQFHVLLSQVEVKHFGVFLDSGRCLGLGQNDVVVLDVPPETNLGGGLTESLSDGVDDRVLEKTVFSLGQWRPGF